MCLSASRITWKLSTNFEEIFLEGWDWQRLIRFWWWPRSQCRFLKKFLSLWNGVILQILMITQEAVDEVLWNFQRCNKPFDFGADPGHNFPGIFKTDFSPLQNRASCRQFGGSAALAVVCSLQVLLVTSVVWLCANAYSHIYSVFQKNCATAVFEISLIFVDRF